MVNMVDISNKKISKRKATAVGKIILKRTTIEKIKSGEIVKGDPLPIAEVAAINAAKQTQLFIPLCHQIQLEKVKTEFEIGEQSIIAKTSVTATAKTGVEMEALVGVTCALNTIWDMVKYLEKDEKGQYPTTKIAEIRVLEKISDEESPFKDTSKEHKKHAPLSTNIAVITLSNTRTIREDDSGDLIQKIAESYGHRVLIRKVIPDDKKLLIETIDEIMSNEKIKVIITNGGTGLSKQDITIETLKPRFDKEIIGFNTLFMSLGYEQVSAAAMLSRATAGLIKGRAIFCLPGSTKACKLALEKLIMPEIGHILKHADD